ncbi:MAG: NifB/NifX family molybdenum-iron cluster-binding protein [Anaerolineales bacterium]|nr:NifB/NifX family molybdenum-iron cluster-binding protein [Anaerolineales bacterium]
MRIAISAENKNGLDSPISHHFGRCPCYVLVDVESNQVKSVQTIDNPYFAQHQPGMVPAFIQQQGANVMISGGMGWRAIEFFQQYGIQVATGGDGTVGQTLDLYLRGQLTGAQPCNDHEGHQHEGDCH